MYLFLGIQFHYDTAIDRHGGLSLRVLSDEGRDLRGFLWIVCYSTDVCASL